MAFAREIIIFILQHVVGFRIYEEEKDSYYGVLGNTLVRISNHCTWLYLWDGFLEKNPKYKGWPIVIIVFEDNQNTFQNTCLTLKRFRNTPIKVTEYVYRLQGNGQLITPNDRKSIANSIKNILNGDYVDTTGKCMRFKRVSNNPLGQNINHGNGTTSASNMNYGADTPIEEEITEHKRYDDMKKQTIRLNESQLKDMIKESVQNVLMESYVWYGDVTPLETIMTACSEIRNRMQDRDFDGYEDAASYELLEWANKVSEQAENFIMHNSDNVSIN